MQRLYILIGNIGSGKSTWAKIFAHNNKNVKIVSGDGFRQMLNGTYEYIVGLDDIITNSMVFTIKELLTNGYDTIVDVCNITEERRKSWMDIPNCKKIAVIFPTKDKQWHLDNRAKESHWDVDSGKVFDGNVKVWQPVIDSKFDDIIEVKEW